MTGPYHLYALVNTGAHQPFYIGATCKPKQRQWAHRQRFQGSFDLVVLETREDPLEIARLETELIAWYITRNVSLQNRALVSYYRGVQRNNHSRQSARPPRRTYSEQAISEWKDRRIKKIEQKQRKKRLQAEAIVCHAKFAEMVADGSAARIALEWLAANT